MEMTIRPYIHTSVGHTDSEISLFGFTFDVARMRQLVGDEAAWVQTGVTSGRRSSSWRK